MKKIILMVCLFTISLGAFNESYSQDKLSRKEKKELKKKWKERAKEYKKNPLELKEKMDAYQKRITSLEQENSDLKTKYNLTLSSMDSLRDSLTMLREQKSRNSVAANDNAPATMEGLVMKVQIGAYNNFDASKFFGGNKCLEYTTEGSLKRYRVGDFNNLDMAKGFVEDMKKMGIKDAWVVPILNGEFITIEKLEEMLKNSPAGTNSASGSEELDWE